MIWSLLSLSSGLQNVTEMGFCFFSLFTAHLVLWKPNQSLDSNGMWLVYLVLSLRNWSFSDYLSKTRKKKCPLLHVLLDHSPPQILRSKYLVAWNPDNDQISLIFYFYFLLLLHSPSESQHKNPSQCALSASWWSLYSAYLHII